MFIGLNSNIKEIWSLIKCYFSYLVAAALALALLLLALLALGLALSLALGLELGHFILWTNNFSWGAGSLPSPGHYPRRVITLAGSLPASAEVKNPFRGYSALAGS